MDAYLNNSDSFNFGKINFVGCFSIVASMVANKKNFACL